MKASQYPYSGAQYLLAIGLVTLHVIGDIRPVGELQLASEAIDPIKTKALTSSYHAA